MAKNMKKSGNRLNLGILLIALVFSVGFIAFGSLKSHISSVIGASTKTVSDKNSQAPVEAISQSQKFDTLQNEESLPEVKLESAPDIDKKGLDFDGVNDSLIGPAIKGATGSTFTLDVWFSPASSTQNSVLVAQSNTKSGWSLELNGGKAVLWYSDSSGQWKSVKNKLGIKAGLWHHVAFVNQAGVARTFVDGVASDPVRVGLLSSGDSLNVGGLTGYPYFKGKVGELRISGVARYRDTFENTTVPSTLDDSTLALYRLDEGQGEIASDESLNRYNLVMGSSKAVESSDPSWY